jgi:hypothetical protein
MPRAFSDSFDSSLILPLLLISYFGPHEFPMSSASAGIEIVRSAKRLAHDHLHVNLDVDVVVHVLVVGVAVVRESRSHNV